MVPEHLRKLLISSSKKWHDTPRRLLSSSPSSVGTTTTSTTNSNVSASARHQSRQISNVFWMDLKYAVQQGNASHAEELVLGLLDEATEKDSVIDTRVFSLVLEAWKDNETSAAATRSQKFLNEMIELNESGRLTEPPRLEDYHVVLNCVKDAENMSLKECSPANMHDLLGRLSKDHSPTMKTYELIMSILAKGGHVDYAKQLLMQVVQMSDMTPSVELYNAVLECWAYYSDELSSNAAHAFLLEMIDEGTVAPNTKTFQIVIGCWTASRAPGAADQAEALLDKMKELQVKPNSKAYKYTIQALAREGEAGRAEALLTRHAEDYSVQFDADLKPDLQAFQSVLSAYSRYHHLDAAVKAEALLEHMKELYQSQLLDTQPNVWSYNTVMLAWINTKSRDAGDRASRLYDEIHRAGLLPDAISLNTLLQANSISKTARETEELFREKVEAYLMEPLNNPQPDSIAFGTVLNAWARSKSEEAPEKAETLLALVQELNHSGWEDCKADVLSYSSVIQCWANSKRSDGPQRAEALFRKLQQLAENGDSEMAPDSICWNSVISAFAQAGDGERAEALFKEMLKEYIKENDHSVAPTIMTFTSVLSGWAKTKNNPEAPERALSILHNMERLHQTGTLDVKPNVVHFSTVLNCLAYSKHRSGAEQAEQLLRKMIDSDDPDVQPNVISYNCVIKAWSFLRDEEALPRVTKLLKEILEKAKYDKKMTPNLNTFGGILKTVADSNVNDKVERAQALESLMQRYQVPMNGWLRNQLRRCKPHKARNASRRRGNGPLKSAQRRLQQIPDVPATY